ncbi:hypothetical protein J4E85_006510 [Alternaria conjuncta]|uniref:uncharacterized protein n=1 Tax=Alternaria conjuncta TaxID=181017 RepID=UPI0022210CA1|nr:uncharacterized protein J4E85_006510 [Alternaria conjuncta]KAI4926218.1 hypothetical protein J4E85_006510 [Alternaria conjuncta]
MSLKSLFCLIRLLKTRNKLKNQAKLVHFDFDLSDLQRFVKSHKSGSNVSIEFTEKEMGYLKHDLDKLRIESLVVKDAGRRKVILRFVELPETDDEVVLRILLRDFWPLKTMHLREGGYDCSLDMNDVKRLDKAIEKWKGSRKS